MGSPGEKASDLTPLAFDMWDDQQVVASGLVSHPGNDRGFGTLLDRDSFCSGNRSTADGRRMVSDSLGEPLCQFGM